MEVENYKESNKWELIFLGISVNNKFPKGSAYIGWGNDNWDRDMADNILKSCDGEGKFDPSKFFKKYPSEAFVSDVIYGVEDYDFQHVEQPEHLFDLSFKDYLRSGKPSKLIKKLETNRTVQTEEVK